MSTTTCEDSTSKCDICLQDEITLKCNSCEFNSSQKCISKWFSSCGNFLCPHCKKEKSYEIDYSKIVFKKKEEDDDIGQIAQIMSSLDIFAVLQILNETTNGNLFNIVRSENQERLRDMINDYTSGRMRNINVVAGVIRPQQTRHRPPRTRTGRNGTNQQTPTQTPPENPQIPQQTQELINPVFSQLPIDIVVSEILKEGQMFSPETFVRNFNTLPIQIRAQWSYKPVKMEIDGVEETIAYTISRINEQEQEQDQEVYEDTEDTTEDTTEEPIDDDGNVSDSDLIVE